MFVLYSKLRNLKGKFKQLNKEELNNLSIEVLKAKNALDQVQRLTLSRGSNEKLTEEKKEAANKYYYWDGLKENFLK